MLTLSTNSNNNGNYNSALLPAAQPNVTFNTDIVNLAIIEDGSSGGANNQT